LRQKEKGPLECIGQKTTSKTLVLIAQAARRKTVEHISLRAGRWGKKKALNSFSSHGILQFERNGVKNVLSALGAGNEGGEKSGVDEKRILICGSGGTGKKKGDASGKGAT